MRLIDDLASAHVDSPTVVTIGAFDGLHIGHQYLIQQLIKHARETASLSVVVTFHPHPRSVLRPWLGPKVLTTPGEKAVLLAQMGLDILVLLRFTTQVARTPAPGFVRTLYEHLHMAELWVGDGFALGHHRQGNVAALRRMGAEWGFQVRVIKPIALGSKEVSSTRVRELLAAGKVSEARRLLGRPYSLAGEVVTGARRGRCLGFPTANLAVRPERAIPPDGVYAVYAVIGDERWPAVANVGERPSFNTGLHAIEVHIIGYEGDLYGRDLVVEFVKRLRPERRFEDICELVRQIGRDVEQARQLFAAEEVEVERQDERGYREVPHTADVALEVWGRDLPQLFERAAEGLFSLAVTVESGASISGERQIDLSATDLETLLVDWLNELLLLYDEYGEAFVDFDVALPAAGELSAKVQATKDYAGLKAIKAATFHNLAIRQEPGGYRTVVVFDV